MTGRPRWMLGDGRETQVDAGEPHVCLLFLQPEYKYVDPICTFLFSILVLGTTLTILRDVILVLMEGTSDLEFWGLGVGCLQMSVFICCV